MKQIARILWWTAAFGLLLLHLIIVGSYTGLLAYHHLGLNSTAVIYWTAALIFAAGLLMGVISRPKRWQKQLSIFNGVAFVAMLVFFIWYLQDAPPIADDYSESKLLYPPNGSYAHLALFQKDDRSESLYKALERLRAADDPLGQPEEIDRLWQEAAVYREAIAALDGYDVINDLPEGKIIDAEVPVLFFSTLRNVIYLHRLYLLKAASEGHSTEAAKTIVRLHRVMRRCMANSTILVNYVIFNAVNYNIYQMVLSAVNDPHCSPEAILLFTEHLKPLKREEYSLERVIKGEYLFMKNSTDQLFKPESFLDAMAMNCSDDANRKPWRIIASLIVYHFGYKPNMTLSDLRRHNDVWVEADRSSPPNYSTKEAYEQYYAQSPALRNMAGWISNANVFPQFMSYEQRVIRLKVQSDLLAIALHRRLGKTLELPDLYVSGPCRFRDDGDRLRHPGPDGAFDTEDDIVLEAEVKRKKTQQ